MKGVKGVNRFVGLAFGVSLCLFFGLSACSPISLSSLVANLNRQTDLDLVCDGAPAYLLMLDSLIACDPENPGLLINGVKAYSAYSAAVAECGRPDRAATLSGKARDYGFSLLKLKFAITPDISLDRLGDILAKIDRNDAYYLFWGAYGWASWVATQDGSPAALADLPKIEKLMLRVVELDESCYHGGAHLFLGIYYGSRPVAYGGRPDLARGHFERALAISGRNFLPALVSYAEYYARPAFDRKLYTALLKEVLAFDLKRKPDLTLANLVAKRRAKKLLAEAADYF